MNCIIILVGLTYYTVNAMIRMHTNFENWKRTHKKHYMTNLEDRYRFAVFTENYANYQEIYLNKNAFFLQLNEFADLTDYEYKEHKELKAHTRYI